MSKIKVALCIVVSVAYEDIFVGAVLRYRLADLAELKMQLFEKYRSDLTIAATLSVFSGLNPLSFQAWVAGSVESFAAGCWEVISCFFPGHDLPETSFQRRFIVTGSEQGQRRNPFTPFTDGALAGWPQHTGVLGKTNGTFSALNRSDSPGCSSQNQSAAFYKHTQYMNTLYKNTLYITLAIFYFTLYMHVIFANNLHF